MCEKDRESERGIKNEIDINVYKIFENRSTAARVIMTAIGDQAKRKMNIDILFYY